MIIIKSELTQIISSSPHITRRICHYIQNNPKIDYLLIFILALHVFAWFKPDVLYIKGDLIIPLNPIENLDFLYTWTGDQTGTTTFSLGNYFFYGFYAFWNILGLDLVASQHLMIYFVRVLTGLSMYYFMSSLNIDIKNKRLTNWMAVLFYMFNPYVFSTATAYLPYAIMPLILGFFINGLECNKFIKYSFFISIASFGVVVDLPQYRMILIMFGFMLLIGLFYVSIRKVSIKSFCSFFVIILSIWIMSYLWLILGFFTSLTSGINEGLRTVSAGGLMDTGWATFEEIIRLFGSGSFTHGSIYGPLYKENIIFILISYSIPTIIFSNLLINRSKHVIFFSVVALIFLFLGAGPNPPFGEFYKWMVNNIPLLRVIRTSYYSMIGVALAYSILIGFFTGNLIDKISGKIKVKLIVVILMGIILINAWPLLVGSIQDTNFSFTGVKIPESYYELNQYINAEGSDDFKILTLPPGAYHPKTDWNYSGPNLFPFIFTKPVISRSEGAPYIEESNENIISIFYRNMDKLNPSQIQRILSLLNIRYVVLDNYTFEGKRNYGDNFPLFKKLYESSNFKMNFGKLVLFKNNQEAPHIFATNDISSVDGNLHALLPLLALDDFNVRSAVILSEDWLSKKNPGSDNSNIIIYRERINQGKVNEVTIPKNNTYLIFINLTADNVKKPIRYKIDNVLWLSYNTSSDESLYTNFKNTKVGEYFFTEGIHRITFDNIIGDKNNYFFLFSKSLNYINQTANLSYEKINPTQHRVKINTSIPYTLVFSESYHPMWNAYINGEKVVPHFLVNGYANAWYINKTGRYSIIINFDTQYYFNIGIIVSLIILLGCIAYLLKHYLKEIIENHEKSQLEKSRLSRTNNINKKSW